jgi:cytochrome c553
MEKRWMIAVASLVLAAWTATAEEAATPADQGKALVEKKKCSMCHALDGKGGKADNESLNAIGTKKSAAEIVDVLTGKTPTPKGKPHTPKLADEDAKAAAAYLKTLK